MVEIVKLGRKPGDMKIKATCRECGTVFTFARHEAEYVSDQRDGDALKIPCPLCSTPHWRSASL